MAALVEAAANPAYPAEIALVVSNRENAPGLDQARLFDLPTAVVDHRRFASRQDFDEALDLRLRENAIDLVCLAGFMRVLTDWFVERWRDRLINIHPSLLPAFPGLDTHARALEAQVPFHGCTVHFVRTAVDAGPIIAQAAVPVGAGDTAETIAARVLAAEHQLYPRALSLVASGRARVVGESVEIDGVPVTAADALPML
jgi:phosphoribosylglycinamide formyltransferase-1